MRRVGFLVLLAFLGPGPGAPAATSDWAGGEDARLRLLLVEMETPGRLAGGIEIAMPPGWHTYWRTPGDVGFPPAFDFQGSENVAGVTVLYPVPERYEDAAGISLIYPDTALFPLEVAAADASRPVTLKLAAQIGVCREVCIPVFLDAAVTLAPGDDDPAARAAIDSALKRVPRAPETERLAVTQVAREGNRLDITLRATAPGPVELFAEGPDGWFLGQPALERREDGTARFTLDLAGRPKGAPAEGAPLRLTASAGGEAIETIVAVP